MKPPTRKRASCSKDLPMEEYSKWNLVERQRLLEALGKYKVDQSSEIAKIVSTKSEAEVINYISNLKRGMKTDIISAGPPSHRKYLRNIQAWIRFTHQLIDDEEQNYSSMIGKLLALYGEYCFKKSHSTGVNFKSIYDYLAGLLLGVQCPVLPPLESALVLDMLKNVATFLAESNTAPHKKFVLLNYQNQMFPDYNSADDRGKSTSRKLFDEVLAPPGSILSSLSCPFKRGIAETKTRRGKHQEELSSNNPEAADVYRKQCNPSQNQTNPDPENQTPEVSNSSVTKRKFPASWRRESANNSSSPEAKRTKDLQDSSTDDGIETTIEIHKENNNLDEQNELSQQVSSGTYLASKNIKQEFRTASVQTEENSFSDSSPNQESGQSMVVSVTREIIEQGQDCSSVQEEINSGTTEQQAPRQTQILPSANASKPFHFPSGGESPQNLLQNPNQDPKEGMIRKRTILFSLLKDPIEDILQRKAPSISIPQNSKNTVGLQNPSGGTVQKRTILSNLPQGSSADTAPQQGGADNVVKVFQMTTEGLMDSPRPQGPGASTVEQEGNKVKVYQVSTRSLANKGPGGIRPLKGSSVEGSMDSQQDDKQSNNKSVEAEFSDSDGDADRLLYEPSVAWLNPMNIPARLINFTKTKQKTM